MALCQCGCGEPAPIAKRTCTGRGHRKGEPMRFIKGHSHRIAAAASIRRGPNHRRWKGGKRKHNGGYVVVLAPDHPKGDVNGCVLEHVLVAERALGRYLPDGTQVHHVNEVKSDNSPGNLVICQDQAYHSLLHQRQRALDACGNPSWRKCSYCKQYDDPNQLRCHGEAFSHDACHNAYRRQRRTA